MTQLRIETVNVNSLTPDPANARKHDGRNLQAIAHSLEKFGQRKPICVTPDSIVVAGNGTLEAAKSLGWTEIAIARTPVGWTWEQIRAFALADNRTAELAEWDDKVLADQLLELDANGWELEELGFENLEPPVGQAHDEEPLSFDDEPAKTKLGDIWKLGNHLFICGDSTHESNWKCDDDLVGVFTSPPYGIGDTARIRETYVPGKETLKSLYAEHTDNPLDWPLLMNDWTTIALEKTTMVVVNVQLLALNKNSLLEWLHNFKNNLIDIAIWNKKHGAPQMAANVMNNAFEFIVLLGKDKSSRSIPLGKFHGTVQNVFESNKLVNNEFSDIHKAMMPVEFAELVISKLMSQAKTIIDPFGGIGTTMIACEKLGKKSISIELDPKYVDNAVKRWESYTGKTAELLGQ
jgi:DNA modification methylase